MRKPWISNLCKKTTSKRSCSTTRQNKRKSENPPGKESQKSKSKSNLRQLPLGNKLISANGTTPLSELVVNSNWNGDYIKLARMVDPQITTDEARDAVKNLLDWGLIHKTKKDDKVQYQETSQLLDATQIPPILLRQIRRDYIQHAIGAVEHKKKAERFAAFTTLAMSEKSYDYAVEVLEEARQKIIAKVANDSKIEKIYEMMIVAFPMSKNMKKEV